MANERQREEDGRPVKSDRTKVPGHARVAQMAALLATALAACSEDETTGEPVRPDFQTLSDGSYNFTPRPEDPAVDSVPLNGVSREEIDGVVDFVRANGAAALLLDLQTDDPQMDATRICDNVEVHVTPGRSSINCNIVGDPLPGGPAAPLGMQQTADEVVIESDISDRQPEVTGPGISKTRVFGGSTRQTFFGDYNNSRQTGEYGREWRIRIAGKSDRNQ